MSFTEKRNMAGIGKLSRQRLSTVLRRAKGGCITTKITAECLKVSPTQARSFLSSWAENGWLLRIRQGLYVSIDLAAKSIDQSFIDPWVVANELFSPCYIGGWSAAKHWDFTEQIFESTLVITSRHINGKNQSADGLHFFIKKLETEKMFGLKPIWKEQIKVQVSDPHKTIIDMLDDPSLGGGIRFTIDCLRQYFPSKYFNSTILIEYALKMHNKTIFKRLGFIASKLYPSATELIEYCRKNISKGISQLDPNSKGDRLLKKWGLWIPEGLI